MAAQRPERRRIETNSDVSRPLAHLRQAYSIHANAQVGPDALPGIWNSLCRNHWAHAWRLHVAQPDQLVGLPAVGNDDPRDFVAFVRHQLAPAELDFALFAVFRDQRVHMHSGTGAEVRRRFNALRGNVGDYSENDIFFELGTDVVQGTPSLRVLNSLLNPRDPAQRIAPALVFQAVREEMLARHQDPVHPPTVTPADVTNAAARK